MLLRFIKREKDVLERLLIIHSLINYKILRKLFVLSLLFFGLNINSQEISFNKGEQYVLNEISVTGLKSFNEQTVITYTGLRKGQKIRIPGEEISAIINKLWKLDLFSDINFYVKKIDGEKIDIELAIEELPTLSEFKITGIKKSKAETIAEDTELKKGKKITQNFIKTTKNYIVNKYKKDGFLNTKVNINVIPDSTEINYSKMLINVDQGDRVKIKEINFSGNETVSYTHLTLPTIE